MSSKDDALRTSSTTAIAQLHAQRLRSIGILHGQQSDVGRHFVGGLEYFLRFAGPPVAADAGDAAAIPAVTAPEVFRKVRLEGMRFLLGFKGWTRVEATR